MLVSSFLSFFETSGAYLCDTPPPPPPAAARARSSSASFHRLRNAPRCTHAAQPLPVLGRQGPLREETEEEGTSTSASFSFSSCSLRPSVSSSANHDRRHHQQHHQYLCNNPSVLPRQRLLRSTAASRLQRFIRNRALMRAVARDILKLATEAHAARAKLDTLQHAHVDALSNMQDLHASAVVDALASQAIENQHQLMCATAKSKAVAEATAAAHAEEHLRFRTERVELQEAHARARQELQATCAVQIQVLRETMARERMFHASLMQNVVDATKSLTQERIWHNRRRDELATRLRKEASLALTEQHARYARELAQYREAAREEQSQAVTRGVAKALAAAKAQTKSAAAKTTVAVAALNFPSSSSPTWPRQFQQPVSLSSSTTLSSCAVAALQVETPAARRIHAQDDRLFASSDVLLRRPSDLTPLKSSVYSTEDQGSSDGGEVSEEEEVDDLFDSSPKTSFAPSCDLTKQLPLSTSSTDDDNSGISDGSLDEEDVPVHQRHSSIMRSSRLSFDDLVASSNGVGKHMLAPGSKQNTFVGVKKMGRQNEDSQDEDDADDGMFSSTPQQNMTIVDRIRMSMSVAGTHSSSTAPAAAGINIDMAISSIEWY